MFVRTDHVSSFNKALVYNEQKVSSGQAALLDAGGFLKSPEDLSLEEKVARFRMRVDMNISILNSHVHMSLNFSPYDRLPERKLKAIAAAYLKQIGFKYQPYLLYQHEDAGHPHLHLIASKIRADGSYINLYNKASSVLNPARQKIEKDFGLIKAEGRKLDITSLSPSAANYGKIPTGQAIQNVLNQTLDSYNYTSLQELNAVLSTYNVKAHIKYNPQNKSQVWALWYYILDKSGRQLSVPIASSKLGENVNWKDLCQRFEANLITKNKGQARIKNEVDLLLGTEKLSVKQFISQLEEKGIRAVFQRHPGRRVYSLTYVDFQKKLVCDSEVLGSMYSAEYIAAKCGAARNLPDELNTFNRSAKYLISDNSKGFLIGDGSETRFSPALRQPETDFLFDLFKQAYGYSYNELPQKKRRRKSRRV